MGEVNWIQLTAPLRRAAELMRKVHRLTRRLVGDDPFRNRIATLDALPGCLTFGPFDFIRQSPQEGDPKAVSAPPSPTSQPGSDLRPSQYGSRPPGGVSTSPPPHPAAPSLAGDLSELGRPSVALVTETETALAEIARLVAILETAPNPVAPSVCQSVSLSAANPSLFSAAPADGTPQMAAEIRPHSPSTVVGSTSQSATARPPTLPNWVASSALLAELLPSPGAGQRPASTSPKIVTPTDYPARLRIPTVASPQPSPVRSCRSPVATSKSSPQGQQTSVLCEPAATTHLAELVQSLWASRDFKDQGRAGKARGNSGSTDLKHTPRSRAPSRLGQVEEGPASAAPSQADMDTDGSPADQINRELIEQAGLRGIDLT